LTNERRGDNRRVRVETSKCSGCARGRRAVKRERRRRLAKLGIRVFQDVVVPESSSETDIVGRKLGLPTCNTIGVGQRWFTEVVNVFFIFVGRIFGGIVDVVHVSKRVHNVRR
jgi:hypothetical protein